MNENVNSQMKTMNLVFSLVCLLLGTINQANGIGLVLGDSLARNLCPFISPAPLLISTNGNLPTYRGFWAETVVSQLKQSMGEDITLDYIYLNFAVVHMLHLTPARMFG